MNTGKKRSTKNTHTHTHFASHCRFGHIVGALTPREKEKERFSRTFKLTRGYALIKEDPTKNYENSARKKAKKRFAPKFNKYKKSSAIGQTITKNIAYMHTGYGFDFGTGLFLRATPAVARAFFIPFTAKSN